jgi:hypothetical protein
MAKKEAPVRTAVGRLLGVHTDERAWRKGAVGEEEVARRLAKLPPEAWTVVHDILIGDNGANVDHVVVGPPGVFALNTKNLTGKVWVAERALLHNGHKTDYLRKSRTEARRVSRLISEVAGRAVQVRPVLVIMEAELTLKTQPTGVSVVARKRIRTWLEKQPNELSRSQYEELAEFVRLPSTWRAPRPDEQNIPPPAGPPDQSITNRVTVKLWQRYGKRRLYVNDATGGALGFFDLDTQSLTLQDETRRTEVERAISNYFRKGER